MVTLPNGARISKKRKGRQDLKSFNREERKARVEAGYGTDVGNFFRRMKNPAAPQTPPSTTNTNNPQNNYEETKKEENTKLNTNYLSLMDKNPGYFQPKQKKEREDLDHKSVGLSKKYIK